MSVIRTRSMASVLASAVMSCIGLWYSLKIFVAAAIMGAHGEGDSNVAAGVVASLCQSAAGIFVLLRHDSLLSTRLHALTKSVDARHVVGAQWICVATVCWGVRGVLGDGIHCLVGSLMLSHYPGGVWHFDLELALSGLAGCAALVGSVRLSEMWARCQGDANRSHAPTGTR